jgi:hypothetical protein
VTAPSWSWLHGPADNPDPHVGDRSSSATAAEAREELTWGELYWRSRRPPVAVDEVTS